jgi:hypothetical protein
VAAFAAFLIEAHCHAALAPQPLEFPHELATVHRLTFRTILSWDQGPLPWAARERYALR